MYVGGGLLQIDYQFFIDLQLSTQGQGACKPYVQCCDIDQTSTIYSGVALVKIRVVVESRRCFKVVGMRGWLARQSIETGAAE